jgi:hypothetical protein
MGREKATLEEGREKRGEGARVSKIRSFVDYDYCNTPNLAKFPVHFIIFHLPPLGTKKKPLFQAAS